MIVGGSLNSGQIATINCRSDLTFVFMIRIGSFKPAIKWQVLGGVLLYGLGIGIVVSVLRWIDYKHMMHSWPTEVYAGVVALVFAICGIWLGMQLHRKPAHQAETTVEIKTAAAAVEQHGTSDIGISRREVEVLQLMSEGLSNQEIADRLFVSLNTVKTHTSKLYSKLDVKRRTQAVHRAKELGLIQIDRVSHHKV